MATRSILRERAESAQNEDDALREEALKFKNTDWVTPRGLQVVKDSIGEYESGGETYKRIDCVSQIRTIYYRICLTVL